jgi:hypothetical protein
LKRPVPIAPAFFMAIRSHLPVIAGEAKQSSSFFKKLDCFVAALLAMTIHSDLYIDENTYPSCPALCRA